MILRVILGLIGNSYLRPKIRENLVVNSKKKCKLHLRLKFRLRKKSLSFCRSHAVRWAGQLHYLSFAMKISELCFHWLWAPERIKFKLAVFVYRTVHGTAPRHCTSVSVWSATPRCWHHIKTPSPVVDLLCTRHPSVTACNASVIGHLLLLARGSGTLCPRILHLRRLYKLFRRKLNSHLFRQSYYKEFSQHTQCCRSRCPTGDVGGTCGQSWTPRSTHYLLTTPVWKRSILQLVWLVAPSGPWSFYWYLNL